MPTQTPLWSSLVVSFVIGCSGNSGTRLEDADDSSIVPDRVSADTEDASRDVTDAEPPPVAPPHCGDGVLDPDEECDDGNRLDGDDCDWLCRRGPGEPVDDTPDPSVGDLERDLPWTSLGPTAPGDVLFLLSADTLAWTGSAFATVWVLQADPSTGPSYGVAHFTLFDRHGRALAPDWTYDYPDRAFSSIALAWSGRHFALVWADAAGGPVSAMLLDAVGKPLVGPFALTEDRGGGSVAVSWDGEAFDAVWTYVSGGGRAEIDFCRFDETGSIRVTGAPVHVWDSLGAGATVSSARVAASGTAVVTAGIWPPGSGDEMRLRWMAIGTDGSLLRPAGDLGPVDQAFVGVAWSGGRFAIPFDAASEGSPDFHLALLDANGFLVGPPRPVCACAWADFVAVAWGAGGWAMAYYRNDTAPPDIHLVRTDATGGFISDTASAHPSALAYGPLAMAFDGEGFGILSGVLGSSSHLLFTRYVVVP